MSVRSREEILEKFNKLVGEDSSDDAISLLEDITDTITDYETRIQENGDWKTKYEENDKEWRNKYKERFFSSDAEEDSTPAEEVVTDEKEMLHYEDLFEVKE